MKVLLTADIHYGNYEDYNITPNARINQFYKLADRYVEIGRENDCKEIWVAGDFLRVPEGSNRVNHGLKKFLKIISEGFDEVKYILGQHDLSTKSTEQSIEDTIISIFDFDNFHYMNKKIVEYGLGKIAFMNWSPDQDVSWIEDKVQVFIGHYTKSDLFGQDIDESKFDIMFHGDIHNDQEIGKFISISNPIQHDMNSISDGSVIILDTDTGDWRRVKVDPDHSRFLRLHYVTEPHLQGFQDDLNYNIYKPNKVVTAKGASADLPQWKDIETLIRNIIKEEDFESIHSEVSAKCVNYSEIDFDFQLIEVRIRGYRSLVEFHATFEPNDLVVLLGKNGSGKSSILNGIRAIWDRSSHIKNERSEFCNWVDITITLSYQNKIYEITKGDDVLFKIDGETQSRNTKPELEAYMRECLPFMNYVDLLFITSNVNNLAVQFTPDRRIELISKFYRLDRIDAYSQTGGKLREEVIQKILPIRDKLMEVKGSLDTIETRLMELDDYKDLDELSLKNEYEELINLRESKIKYDNWLQEIEKAKSSINQQKSTLDLYKSKLEVNVDELKDNLISVERQINDNKAKIEDLLQKDRRLFSLKEKESIIKQKGIDMGNYVETLKEGKCEVCGSRLADGDAHSLIESKTKILEHYRSEYLDILKELEEFSDEEKSLGYFKKNKLIIENANSELSHARDFIKGKIDQYVIAKEAYNIELDRLKNYEDKLESILSQRLEEVILPPDLNDRLSDLISKITKIQMYHAELEKKKEKSIEYDKLDKEIKELNDLSQKYLDYSALMSRTGRVYGEILTKLAEAFSEDDIKYECRTWTWRGKLNRSFNALYKVKGNYRVYERLSDGQKTVCDLDFLSKLFSVRVGILALDEHLKALDEENLPKAADILNNMNVNTILVATHDRNFTPYTKRFLLELDESGKTIYTIN